MLATSRLPFPAEKLAELTFLKSTLMRGCDLPDATDWGALVAQKAGLRRRILEEWAEGSGVLTETATGSGFESSDLSMRWTYQRCDLEIDAWHPALELASVLGDVYIDAGYAASGMSAITSVILALSSRSDLVLVHAADAYFETVDFARRFIRSCRTVVVSAGDKPSVIGRVPGEVVVVLLDSFGEEAPMSLLATTAAMLPDYVVVDSTCYSAAGKDAAALLRAGLRIAPVIVVRSHVKLDQLGLEFTRLGSYAIVAPDAPDRGDISHLRRLAADVRAVLARTGGGPQASVLLPLLFSRERAGLDAARAGRTQNGCWELASRLEAQIDPAVAVVRRFHHGAFVCVHMVRHGATRQSLDGWAREFAGRKGAVRAMNGFGFDWPCIDSIFDLRRGQMGEVPVIRISPGDGPPEVLEQLALVLPHEIETLAGPTAG